MRILLADDHELVRDSIAAVLRNEPGFQVEVVSDLPSALARLDSDPAPFDLILLDYMMPGMNGLAGLAAIRGLSQGRPVALLSGTAPRAVAEQALSEGAAGYLPKTMSTRSLIAAAHFMAAGEIYAPPSLINSPGRMQTNPNGSHLTQRERDVLKGLHRSLSNKEIALQLDVQEATVKLHVKSLYRKIGARNRIHAVLIAMQAGLL